MKLTPEFAEEVDLSPKPWIKHIQVMDMLDDPEMVGPDNLIQIDQFGCHWQLEHQTVEQPSNIVVVQNRWPLLGRGVLRRVAEELQKLESGG